MGSHFWEEPWEACKRTSDFECIVDTTSDASTELVVLVQVQLRTLTPEVGETYSGSKLGCSPPHPSASLSSTGPGRDQNFPKCLQEISFGLVILSVHCCSSSVRL